MMRTDKSDPPPTKYPSSGSVPGGESTKDVIVVGSGVGWRALSDPQVARRRDFARRQSLRRRVYRDLTSFRTFPLQAMAVEDFDAQSRGYLHMGEGFGATEDSDSSESRAVGRRVAASPSECDLCGQFLHEFLRERSIRAPAVPDIATKAPQTNDGARADFATRGKNAGGETDAANKLSPDDEENAPQKFQRQKPAARSMEYNQGSMDRLGGQHRKKPSKALTIPSSLEDSHFLPTLWSMEPRLFAMETAIKGKRRYVSAHLGRFIDHYWRECDAHSRHFYELIKEDTPCRLYFDLEFNKHANRSLTSTITEDLLTELFEEIRHQFQLIYSISIERSGMVDLDSSTTRKFSRHWIFHLPNGELFPDAREAGVFVKGLVSRLEEEQESGQLQSRGHKLLADNLLVNAEGSEAGNEKLMRFIDLGVYTRNRIFRMLGSTKFGKTPDAALRIAEANEFPFPVGFGNAKFYLPAIDASSLGKLVVDDGDDADDGFKKFCKSLSWEDHAAAMVATLVVPANAGKMNYPTLDAPSKLLDGDEKHRLMTLRSANGFRVDSTSSRYPQGTPSYGKSPFPKLENFVVNTLGRREGLVGRVSTWSLGMQRPLPQMVCYNMKDNRFCENIGRAHKGNNIMWKVHLVNRTCWQACHDPECKGFRGQLIDLPEQVNLEIDEYFLDYELSSLDENRIQDNKENEPAAPNDNSEFDDPSLEAALVRLDVSSIVREKDAEAELDDEFARLNLTDIILGEKCGNNEFLQEAKKGNVDDPARKNEAEEELGDNFAKLTLLDIVSNKKCGNIEPLSEVKTQNADILNESKPDGVAILPGPWEYDDDLDSELAKLNLSNFS